MLYAGTEEAATTDRGCNKDMLRADGSLALIGVSDEDEQSDRDASSWVAQLTSVKDDPSRVHLSAIVGDLPSGCENAEAGDTWATVAQLTGGATYSICGSSSTWASNLGTIVQDSAGLGVGYPLASTPDVATLVVSVDGTTSYDWTYDEATNSIVFTEAAGLTWNQDISVAYEIAQTCSG